jgi:murein L,D-transpeptidase YcbB/YkuD
MIGLVAVAVMAQVPVALGQTAPQASSPPHPLQAASPPASRSAAAPAKPSASSPEARSAAALAWSDEPIFDEGTAERIRQAALSYSDIAVRGGWPVIPPDARFAPGVSGPHDDLLRRRLTISGDLETVSTAAVFDDALGTAVKRFQLRHGLAPTGTVTPRTLAALNVPVTRRIQQLEASLERLANMDFAFGPRYVVVNLPATYAEAVENDRVVRRYRVIVGKTEKPSPTLTAEITEVNLNPTWTVPQSIVKNEIAAHVRKDPGYLGRMHMQVLDAHDAALDPHTVDWSAPHAFTVRQDSGTWNALGAVRIDMPNSYSVYMHDTNQKNLFNDDYRFDSHGCTRVDNVRDLAAWLLKDVPRWSRSEIDLVIASGQREDIRLHGST